MLLRLGNLRGVYIEPAPQFVQRLLLFECFERHLRFELCGVLFSSYRHPDAPRGSSDDRRLIAYSPVQFSGATIDFSPHSKSIHALCADLSQHRAGICSLLTPSCLEEM